MDAIANSTEVMWCSGGCTGNEVKIGSVVISIFTILVNLSAVIVINSNKTLRLNTSGMLMCSMCVSGCIKAFNGSVFSFCVTTLLLWENLPLCVLTYVMSTANSLVGLSTLAGLALDRLIAVTYHLRYESIVTPTKSFVFIILQWCVCIGCSVLPLMTSDTSWCLKRFGGCGYENSTIAIVVIFLVVYVPSYPVHHYFHALTNLQAYHTLHSVSVGVMLVSYIKLWLVVRRLRRQHSNSEGGSRYTGIRTTILVTVAFCVCTLPRAVYAIGPFSRTHSSNYIFEDISALTFDSNSVLSTLVYCGTNQLFKKYIGQIYKRKIRKVSTTASYQRKVSPGVWTVVSHD